MELQTVYSFPVCRDYVNLDTVNPDINIGVSAFHTTDEYVALAAGNMKIYLFDKNGEHQRTLESREGIIWAMTSPSEPNILISVEGHRIRLWNTLTGECLRTLSGHLQAICSLATSEKSSLFSGGVDGAIRGWNTASGSCCWVFEGRDKNTITQLIVHGQQLISTSIGGDIQIRDMSSGEPLLAIKAEDAIVRCLVFGGMIITGAANGNMSLWSLHNGSLITNLLGHNNAMITNLGIIQDNYLLSTDAYSSACVWDLTTRKRVSQIGIHEGAPICHGYPPSVFDMAIHGTGKVLTAGTSGHLKLWRFDRNSGRLILEREDQDADMVWKVKSLPGTQRVIVVSTFNEMLTVRIGEVF